MRFHDDISTHLATSLFPRLANVHTHESRWWIKRWGRKVVQLHETTLATIYVKNFGSNKATMTTTQTRSTHPAQSSSQGAFQWPNAQKQIINQLTTPVNNSQLNTAPSSQNPAAKSNPLLFLFLSADVASNASRARSANVGNDDHEVFNNLRATYNSFPSKWYRWKRPIGIKFYRVIPAPLSCFVASI